MPIKPENRARYPKDWKAIVEQVRERSGDRCEGSPDFPDCRAQNGRPHPETGSKVVLTTAPAVLPASAPVPSPRYVSTATAAAADAPEAAGVEALSAGLRAQFDPRGLFRAGMEH